MIGPFEVKDFIIRIDVGSKKDNGDNSQANFYSADGKVLSLKEDDEIRSFIITFKETEDCY